MKEYRVEDRGHNTPCWIWQKWKNDKGYGSKFYKGKTRRAHRVYYEMKHGTIPEGMHLDHLCTQPSCVRPSHLEPVTNPENQRRRARFTQEMANELRALRPKMSQTALAERFGISRRYVRDILEGKYWNGPAWQ